MSEPDETWAAEIKGRAASILCEAGALCGWPAPNCNAREGAEALYQAGLLAARSTAPEAGKAVGTAVDWREAMQLAIDYLKETKRGSPARSAGHNARLVLESALTASEAEAADLRRKLEEHQDAEDKAAREMATVIQGLRNRATAAERKLEEARKALERAVGLVDAMIANDPNEPVSDSGHVALDLWKHEAESLRAISKGAENG